MNRSLSPMSRREQEMISKMKRRAAICTDLIEKFRTVCLTRGSTGILGLSRVFRRMDEDGNKMLNKEEFAQGITDSGLEFSSDEVDELFGQFDANEDGNISLDEFLIKIRPELSPTRINVIDMAFDKMDENGDGTITVEDLRDRYNVHSHPKYMSGEATEDQILTKFLSNFNNGLEDGIVTKEEFVDYYRGVSASIDEDVYFDLMMRQAYKL